MIWALVNDLIQRAMTFNKSRQRRHLASLLRTFGVRPGGKVLDFGCGTALFAPVFLEQGLSYCGYDIDTRLLRYAARLYPNAVFLSRVEELRAAAPFDLIVANCCFHHIDDAPLAEVVRQVHGLLSDDGTFVLIDLAASEGKMPVLKRLFLMLDQGIKVRTSVEYRRVIEPWFEIGAEELRPQPLGPLPRSPMHQDLAVFVSRKIVSNRGVHGA